MLVDNRPRGLGPAPGSGFAQHAHDRSSTGFLTLCSGSASRLGLDDGIELDPEHKMKSTLLISTCALAFAMALSPTAAAQDVIGGGFAQTASQPVPAAFASYATLSTGERVVFDGISIDLYDAGGGFLLNLATLPGFVFNSFVLPDPTETFALVGESSNGVIYKVALDGSNFSALATLVYNFDAVFEDAGTAIVSAATCGTGCGNDIFRLDVNTGVTTLVANVPGASGPVAMDGNGDLYYGTASALFPAPPGSSDLIYWTATELQGGLPLGVTDATVFHGGLDAATSLAIDPVFGNVFLVESIWGGTSRILEFDGSSGNEIDVVVESQSWLSTIELETGADVGHFHAYQPADGVYLHYNNSSIVTVRPQRPTATLTQTGSVATLQISGAEPNGAMLLLHANQANFNHDAFSYQLSFDFLFHTGVHISQVRRTPFLLPVDANGDGMFQYFDPGNLAGTKAFQVLITDVNGQFIGSSDAAFN